MHRRNGFVANRPDRGAAEFEGHQDTVWFAVSQQEPPAVAFGDRIGDAEPEPVAGQGVTVAPKVALKLL